MLGNLTPQEIAIAAFLHQRQAATGITPPQQPRKKPRIPGVTLPYFIVKPAIDRITHYNWRRSTRSISGLCCDVYFSEADKAKAFAKTWAQRLPHACKGVLLRQEQGEFKVSIPCYSLE